MLLVLVVRGTARMGPMLLRSGSVQVGAERRLSLQHCLIQVGAGRGARKSLLTPLLNIEAGNWMKLGSVFSVEV